jgi:hypothetical protein
LTGLLDTPVDHIPQQDHVAGLHLELGVGFGMSVGRIRVTHVALRKRSKNFVLICQANMSHILNTIFISLNVVRMKKH